MLACPQCFSEFESAEPASSDSCARFCPHDGSTLQPVIDPLIGVTLLGQFELRDVLGQGASGTVYRAWQAPMERWVAVKVLHPDLAEDPAMVARMAREARAVGRLSHPGIVTVHATGVAAAERPFLVMELVDGVTLDSTLGAAPMAPERVISLGLEIAGALAASHEAGVVHRDLKPENVMLAGRDGRVVVLDFGIAKLVGGALVNGDGRLTADGAICGTPYFISPEQASGESVDHRADIYSLGVLLYRLATGRLPFDGNPVAVLLGHVQDTPAPPSSIAPVPRRLAEIIERCMSKQPEARYADTAVLMDALHACARKPHWQELAPTVPVATLSAEDTAHLPVRRWRPLMAAALSLVLASGVGALAAQAWSGQATPTIATRAVTPHQAVTAPHPARDVSDLPDIVSTAGGPARRAVVVGQDGYSMRLLLPERMVIGVDYEFLLEVWDRSGQPIHASEIVLTLDDSALTASRGVAAKPTRRPGVYSFRRAFDAAGAYQVRVYPPAGGTSIRVFVEVVDPSVGSS